MSAPENTKDQYRDTVFLPKTEFPMRGELPKKEPEIVKKWQQGKQYEALRKNAEGREKWILHDGPPYANGNIHIGHAMNKVKNKPEHDNRQAEIKNDIDQRFPVDMREPPDEISSGDQAVERHKIDDELEEDVH